MKNIHIVAAFLLPLCSPIFSAPFCVVSSTGKNCWYYDVNSCRQAAAQNRGMCIYEEEKAAPYTPPPQYIPPPPPREEFKGFNFSESFKAGMEASQPFIEAIQKEQENQRRQESHAADMRRRQEEIELLRQQQEYYRSLQENSRQQGLVQPEKNPAPAEYRPPKTEKEKMDEEIADKRRWRVADSIAMVEGCVGKEANSEVCQEFIQKHFPKRVVPQVKPSDIISPIAVSIDTLWTGFLRPGGSKPISSPGNFSSLKECQEWSKKKQMHFGRKRIHLASNVEVNGSLVSNYFGESNIAFSHCAILFWKKDQYCPPKEWENGKTIAQHAPVGKPRACFALRFRKWASRPSR